MHRGVIKIRPEASVLEAAKLMSEKEIGSLLIEEEDEVGILTERDLLKRVVAQGRDAEEVRVREVMTPSCLTAEENMDIEEANRIMQEKNIRRLPITKEGEIIGMVTIRDLTKSLTYSRLKRKQDYSRKVEGSSWG